MVKDKIAKVVIIVLLCVVVYKVVDVYAAYKSMAEEKIEGNIEPWVIFVNNVDIVKYETATFDLTKMITDSQYVKTGKIAPGTKIQIPIKIDASKTKNLDIRYDITIEGLNDVNDILKIQSVVGKNANKNLVRTGVNTYTGIIYAEDTLKEENLNISLMWENNEELNERDTQLGTSKQRIVEQVPVTVKVSQYMNEEINRYSE